MDTFAATLSAGPAIKTVVVGLLNDVSVESVQRLARTIYTRVVDTIGLNDKRKSEEQIDSLLRISPDLILVAGGTDGGATHSVQHLIETIGLACYLLPTEKRPALLFAGNKNLAEEIKSTMQPLTSSLSISANIRPNLETEDLQPAQHALAELYTQIRRGQMNGVDELNNWSSNALVPTAYAEGRIHPLPQPGLRFQQRPPLRGSGCFGCHRVRSLWWRVDPWASIPNWVWAKAWPTFSAIPAWKKSPNGYRSTSLSKR